MFMNFNKLTTRGAVAVAVAATCGFATAATVSTGPTLQNVTAQKVGDQVAGGTITVDDLKVTLGAQYSANSRVTLTFSNARFASTKLSVSCLSGTGVDMTLSREQLGGDGDSSVVYLVTGVSAGQNTTSGIICDFADNADMKLQTSSLSGQAKVFFSAKNSLNDAIDNTTTPSATLASVGQQFSFAIVKKFDGIIDVGNDRLNFTTVDNTATGSNVAISATNLYAIDRLHFDVGTRTLGASNTAANLTFETTITGDFSWTKESAETSCSASSVTGGSAYLVATVAGLTGSNVTVSATDCTSVTVKVPAATLEAKDDADGVMNASVTLAAVKVGTSTAALSAFAPVTAFSGTSSAFKYGSAQSLAVANWDGGTWTTNGTTIDVPYMPFGQVGPAISHVITLNNRAATAGNVTVSAWRAEHTTGGVTYAAQACTTQNHPLGSVGAASVKNFTTEITNYIRNTCGWTQQTRVALRLDSATPANSTDLYTSFTVDGTRSNVVVNSSNGRGATTR